VETVAFALALQAETQLSGGGGKKERRRLRSLALTAKLLLNRSRSALTYDLPTVMEDIVRAPLEEEGERAKGSRSGLVGF